MKLEGYVVGLFPYPVKSMQGNAVAQIRITEQGLHGDRLWAVQDVETGLIVTAKKQKDWGALLECRAWYEPNADGDPVLWLSIPGVGNMPEDVPAMSEALSKYLDRDVRLVNHLLEGGGEQKTVQGHSVPGFSFADAKPVHLITTKTLESLQAEYPGSDFDPRRFRPNILIDTAQARLPYPENLWVGRRMVIGEAVLEVVAKTQRCVMTSLPQGELPNDLDILRASTRQNNRHAGVYLKVHRAGIVAVHNPVIVV